MKTRFNHICEGCRMAQAVQDLRRCTLGVVFVAFAFASPTVWGQEALRLSLAGEEAARARRVAATTLGYYNLKLGPSAWRLTAGLGLEWSDNVRFTGNDPKADFILSPGLSTRMLWPITDKNSLNLTLGGGYSFYTLNSELSRLFITPGSELSWDIYTGDVTINVHERFSINQFSYQDPTVVGVGNYSQFQNTAGVSALFDLNKALVRAGYDHQTYRQIAGRNTGFSQGSESDQLYASAGYHAGSMALVGVEGGGGLIRYDSPFITEAIQWSAGVFSDAVLSQYITVRGSVGYTGYMPQEGPFAEIAGDFSGYYFQLQARHRVNQYLNYSLSAGRTINLTLFGGSVDSYFGRLNASWNFIRQWTLSTSLDYERGEELQFIRERYDWFGGGLTLGRRITEHLSGSIRYQGHWRDSNLPARNYVVNTLSLQFNYSF